MKTQTNDSMEYASVSGSKIYNEFIKCLKKGELRASYRLLCEYMKYIQNTGENFDASIFIAAFEKYIWNNNVTLNYSDYYMHTKITNPKLSKLYREFVDAFNASNYDKCIELSGKMAMATNDETFINDLEPLNAVLKRAKKIDLEFYNSKMNYYEELLKAAINAKNCQEIVRIIKEILTQTDEPSSTVYSTIYSLMSAKKFAETEEILNSFQETTRNKDMLQTLRRALVNFQNFEKLPPEKKSSYAECKSLGKMHFHDGEYNNAYITFTLAFQNTSNSIFLYYIGKVLFYLQKYSAAEEYLTSYVSKGTTKLSKAYTLLAKIASKQNDEVKAAEYYRKANKYIALYQQKPSVEKMNTQGSMVLTLK